MANIAQKNTAYHLHTYLLKRKDALFFWLEISQSQESCILTELLSVKVVSYIFWFDHWPSRAGQWKEMPISVAFYAAAVWSFGSISETLGLGLDTFCLSTI